MGVVRLEQLLLTLLLGVKALTGVRDPEEWRGVKFLPASWSSRGVSKSSSACHPHNTESHSVRNGAKHQPTNFKNN